MSSEALEQPPPPETRSERAYWLWLTLIVVLGGALRFLRLGEQSFWYDELASVELASNPPRQLWSEWMVRESNPPLYYTLLHYWMRAFGDSEAAVRSLSALIGSTAPLLFYLIGRRLASARVGLVAAALAAVSTLQVVYSQEARGYILTVVATLVVILALSQIADRIIDSPLVRGPFAEASPWLLYVLGCSVALYSHTTMVLLPLLANLYFLWLWAFRSERRVDMALRWVAANGVCLLLWSWWGSITIQQMAFPRTNYAWIPRPTPLDALLITHSVYLPVQLGIAALIVSPVLLVTAARGLRVLRRDRAVLLALFGLGAPLLLFLISQKVPIFLMRTLLWAQFTIILALAARLAAMPGRRQAVAVALVLTALSLNLARWMQVEVKEPWREIIAALQRRVGPNEVVLFSSAAIGAHFQHYCRQPSCQTQSIQLLVPEDEPNRWAEGFFHGPVIRPDELPAVLARYDRVYTLARNTDDPLAYLQPIAEEESAASVGAPPSSSVSVRVWRARTDGATSGR